MDAAALPQFDLTPFENHSFSTLTAEEWVRWTAQSRARFARRPGGDVLDLLLSQKNGEKSLFGVNDYDHALQSATRALRNGEGEECITACLLHDVFEWMNPHNHDKMAGDLLRYVLDDELVFVVSNHAVFQKSFRHNSQTDTTGYEKFRGHPHFERTHRWCELYDQCAFDPNYDTMPFEAFEPVVRRVFTTALQRYSRKYPYPGVT
jgi:predicted HD phosphohydrolase